LRGNPGIKATEILNRDSAIYSIIYNKRIFPGGLPEARKAAEEAA
jgi:hypothetical protein